MLVWLGLVAVARAAATAVETEEVFYLGDPQIGFSGNASIDAKRYERPPPPPPPCASALAAKTGLARRASIWRAGGLEISLVPPIGPGLTLSKKVQASPNLTHSS